MTPKDGASIQKAAWDHYDAVPDRPAKRRAKIYGRPTPASPPPAGPLPVRPTTFWNKYGG